MENYSFLLRWRTLFLSVGLLLLSGCATYTGNVNNGVYTSPDQKFKVNVPSSATSKGQHLNYNVRDERIAQGHGTAVDFMRNFPYWMEDAWYSVEWTSCSQACYPNTEDFYQDIGHQTSSYLANNFSGRARMMRVLSSQDLTVNGRAAYQYVAKGPIDDTPAALIVTVVNFKNAVGTAFMLFPINPNKPLDPQLPWKSYNRFLNSLQPL